MSPDERSRAARRAAEAALVRITHHYNGQPEFVVVGGLIPEFHCSRSSFKHAGTTDIDVQVNLEIFCGSRNAQRLEHALRNSEFMPDSERVWRWKSENDSSIVVKFELLADFDDKPAQVQIIFNECDSLGAVNLRGTGLATKDVEERELQAKIGGVTHKATIKITGVCGFLMAKCAAAHSRRKPKDWYDIAFVLLHNDDGQPRDLAEKAHEIYSGELLGWKPALEDLHANFENGDAQGPAAYAEQLLFDYPEEDQSLAAADAVLAVTSFCSTLLSLIRARSGS